MGQSLGRFIEMSNDSITQSKTFSNPDWHLDRDPDPIWVSSSFVWNKKNLGFRPLSGQETRLRTAGPTFRGSSCAVQQGAAKGKGFWWIFSDNPRGTMEKQQHVFWRVMYDIMWCSIWCYIVIIIILVIFQMMLYDFV